MVDERLKTIQAQDARMHVDKTTLEENPHSKVEPPERGKLARLP